MAKRLAEETRRRQLLEATFAVACREGIGGVTVRSVAAEARVSHGLVLFHFGRKERLIRSLLEWLIDDMAVLHVSEDIAAFPRSLDRLHALMQQEMARQSHQPEHMRLFLEFWALGAQQEDIRIRIRAELARYRRALSALMEDVLGSDPVAYAGMTPTGLSAVAVSWIHGCAVQTMMDPAFDRDEYLAAVRGLIEQVA